MLITHIKKTKILIFFLIAPVYLTLTSQLSIRFDVTPFNKSDGPTVPVGLLVLALYIICTMRVTKSTLVLFIILAPLVILNLYYGIYRALFYAVGALIPLVAYGVMRSRLMNYDEGMLNNIRSALYYVISLYLIIKFINSLIYGFGTTNIFGPLVRIYSFYDYFGAFIVLAILLSVERIFLKKGVALPFLIIVFSFIELKYTSSRLFMYGSGLALILSVFPLTKYINGTAIVTVGVFFVGLITVYSGLYINFEEKSLGLRIMYWGEYFKSLEWYHLFFPWTNEFRALVKHGSFHNEILDMFSFFGIYSIFIFIAWGSAINRNLGNYKTVLPFVMLLVAGMLVQLNITNPFVGILLGVFLAVNRPYPKGPLKN